MNTIGELFARKIDRPIEEVIKVDQANEAAVRTEIEEYVATDSLREEFATVYREIAEGPAVRREGIGVWVSGFFGSGKSTFAKLLGYTVSDRKVGGTGAAELFKRVLQDEKTSALLDSITTRIPFKAVIFDASADRGVRSTTGRLTEIMYRVLLHELGYAEDFDLAELEMALETDGRLAAFESEFQKLHGGHWRIRRQMGLAINEASAVMNRLDPATYPSADSYAVATSRGRADVTPRLLAERAFDLAVRRAPGAALLFVIDEVGQFVSRSVDKMLDLSAIIQEFGIEGRNRTERHKAVSPFWIVVTSQEKLDEIVTALDSKPVELARMQDRFRVTLDMKQSDIVAVTAERVLSKTPAADAALAGLFAQNAARIKEFCTLEHTERNLDINAGSFSRLYPYLPYQIELCIDIVAGLRLRRGEQRHVGGSNRTIIKQAQQMMINERTHLAREPIGSLVTLDLVYELLDVGNLLPSEVSLEVTNVASRMAAHPLALKVVKAIVLLQAVKNLPRTAHNIAVTLHPSVSSCSIRAEVQKALDALENAQFVRVTEDGYKLLTAKEKDWETRRNGREPREADRNRLHREFVKTIFEDPRIRSYKYDKLRGFRLSLTLNGESVESDGDVSLNILLPVPEEWDSETTEARGSSASTQTELFWVSPQSEEVRASVTEVFRSRDIIGEYDRAGASQRLTAEESACLADERSRRDRLERELRARLLAALEGGAAFFQGVQYDASALGRSLPEMLGALLDRAVPILYPKLEAGVLKLSGDEPEKLLTSANLGGMSEVFYDSKNERSLVIKQAGHFVPNAGCDLCREILDHLRHEHEYGNKVTGKAVEARFCGLGYGWERDALRLALAVLFRAGAVEVTHQGRRYLQYTEPAARAPFCGPQAFRAASFSPRETLDLKVLAAAAHIYEEMSGKDVNIEEGELAAAFKQVARSDREELLPAAARLGALRLPGASIVETQLAWVEGIAGMAPDDCVKTLASEGRTYLESRRRASELARLATDENSDTIRAARRVRDEQWAALEASGPSSETAGAAQALQDLLASDDCLRRIAEVKKAMDAVDAAYLGIYANAHEKRRAAYAAALEAVKGRPEWLQVSDNPAIGKDQLDRLLFPLRSRAEAVMDLLPYATVCAATRATLAQLESDTAAVEAVASDVLRRLLEIAAPEEKIERVRVAGLYTARITSPEELDEFISELRDRLSKVLARGDTIILE